MFTLIKKYLDQVVLELDSIPQARKEELKKLATWYSDCKGEMPAYVFICTHNSRRSHLCQIWAVVAAAYHNLEPIGSFSGGLEITSLNPRIVLALKRAGFQVKVTGEENPRFEMQWSEQGEPVICFSKLHDDPSNPQKDFLAVMTCSDADENCPVISGATDRISLPYVDPKISDGTTTEVPTYDACCREIAREMLYAFGLVGS